MMARLIASGEARNVETTMMLAVRRSSEPNCCAMT